MRRFFRIIGRIVLCIIVLIIAAIAFSFIVHRMQLRRLATLSQQPLQKYITETSPYFVLTNANVIDGTGSDERKSQSIVVRDGKIAWVGAASDMPAQPGAKLIDLHHASMESRPGKIPGYNIPMPNGQVAKVEVHDTTCVDVVDSKGNVYSATPSGAWLPADIAGDTGIAFGSRLQTFLTVPGHPNVVEDGKRPRVTLSPTMLLKDGKPFLAISTPGADNQDQALLQVILNIIVFNMTPQEAVESPRFQTEAFYSSFAMHEFIPGKLNLESRIPKATADKLTALGHIVTVTGPWTNASAPIAIEIGANGVLQGGADPRRGRFIDGD